MLLDLAKMITEVCRSSLLRANENDGQALDGASAANEGLGPGKI